MVMPSAGRSPGNAEGPEDQDGLTCEICGGQMVQRQCKILCPNCGYTRDCSDP